MHALFELFLVAHGENRSERLTDGADEHDEKVLKSCSFCRFKPDKYLHQQFIIARLKQKLSYFGGCPRKYLEFLGLEVLNV